ncbi:MAG: ketopantoate reductase family protein [Candidatus Omnitrophica bacterium]|nr:ketopantoate reductase family protein [Candidatus Omnitrophota bacterium]
MKIAVIGAGAIGSLVAGYLKSKAAEVHLVGHADAVDAVKKDGLRISGVRGELTVPLDITERLSFSPEVVILATKTQDLEAALQENLTYIKDAVVVTTQNGIRADTLAARYVPEGNIVSSIVMFGATLLEPGKITHNFEGSWIIGRMYGLPDASVLSLSQGLGSIFPVILADEIKGMKCLKIFVNANNCIPAILGKSMQESFADIQTSQLGIAIWREGLAVMNNAGVRLISLPDFPLERLTKLVAMPPQEAAKIFSGIMTGLSKEPLYGSILQSIKRGKASEIDYINGEFVSLARQNNLSAPLNTKLVEMVHQVEGKKKFFSKDELLSSARALYN